MGISSIEWTYYTQNFWWGQGSVTLNATDFVSIAATAVNSRWVYITNSTFTNTTTGTTSTAIDSTGGDIQIAGSTFTGGGRIVCTSGALNITGSSFRNLTAPSGQSGGAVSLSGCQATIANSTFAGNRAAGGGAIAALGAPAVLGARAAASSSLSVTSSQFSGNTATKSGGAIQMQSSAGVAHAIKLRFVEFDANSAPGGGAIDLGGQVLGVDRLVTIPGSSLDASAVTFRGNLATNSGAAILGMDFQVGIARGLFTGNRAGDSGGAVYLATRTAKAVVFANSLFVRNTAKSGSAFSGNVAHFLYSTVSLNDGIAISNQAGAPVLTFSSSILSGNGTNCDPALPAGAIVDGGHNLQFPGSSCGAITIADPLLDSMYIPGIGSLAQASGDNAVCARPEVNHMDLLGQHRPRVAVCTTGAIEGEIESLVRTLPDPGHRIPSGAPDFTITANPPIQTVKPGGTATYTITAIPTNGFGDKIVYSVSGAPPRSSVTVAPVHGMTSSLQVSTVPADPAGSASPAKPTNPSSTTDPIDTTTSPGSTAANVTWVLTISAKSGSMSRSVLVSLSVSDF